ncbi:MAG: hypothetical protein D6705_12195 [Deltaproteobacteria bacterium]|nr:MAG: hypothetical protein D6705_12195 [Deltaproteobacteria bacterium]
MAWLHRYFVSSTAAWFCLATVASGCSQDELGGPDTADSGGASTGLSGGTTGTPGECASSSGPDCETDSTAGGGTGGTGPDTVDPESPCTDVDCGPEEATCVLDADLVPHCQCPTGMVDVALRCVPCDPVEGPEISVDLNAVPTRVSVAFEKGEETIASTPYDVAEIALRNRQTGDEIVLGTTMDEKLEAQVLPGVYDVEYRSIESSGLLPANAAGRISGPTAVPIENQSDFTIEPAYLSLRLTVAGGDPASDGELGRVFLRREGNPRDVFEVLSTEDDTALVAVLPGRYEVLYRAVSTLSAGGKLPKNTETVVPDVFVEVDKGEGAEVPKEILVNLPTFTTTLVVTVGGAAAPNAPTEFGRIHAVDASTGAATLIGDTSAPMGAIPVGPLLPGVYDLYYELGESQSGQMPANRWVRIGTVDWSALSGNVEVPMAIDVPVQLASFDLSVGGAPIDPADGVAEIWLRGEHPDDEIYVGRTNDADLSVRVIPGTYRVLYRTVNPGVKLPENGVGDLGEITVPAGGPSQHAVDLEAATVTGTVTVGGGPGPDSQYEHGWLYLFDPETGGRVVLGDTGSANFLRRVLPKTGAYQLRYEVEQGGGVVPANTDAIVQKEVVVEVAEPVNLDVLLGPVDLGIVPVYGGGAVPPTVDWGTIWLRDVETGARFPVGTSTNETSRAVLPGTYVVEYQAEETAAKVLPQNSRGAVRCISVQ